MKKDKHRLSLNAMLYAVQIQFSIKQISICIAYNGDSLSAVKAVDWRLCDKTRKPEQGTRTAFHCGKGVLEAD